MSEHARLHLVFKPVQYSTALSRCLEYCLPGDSLLFIAAGTASIAVLEQSEFAGRSLQVFWLAEDLSARALTPLAEQHAWQLIDAAGFVELVEQHGAVQSWV